jgi:hypothetical protein
MQVELVNFFFGGWGSSLLSLNVFGLQQRKSTFSESVNVKPGLRSFWTSIKNMTNGKMGCLSF